MFSFLLCVFLLIASYFIYGKFLEKVAGVDGNRSTPAYKLQNNVDYKPLPKIKNFLIHFLNIAGLGPIFGVIQGVLFGPSAFLWITFGTIFIGCVHDFFSGFMSLRNDGLTMPLIISKYLGKNIQRISALIIILTGIFVAATFAIGAADLLVSLTSIPQFVWILIIFLYFLFATVFPIDKIIGKIYPIFGLLFLIMVILMISALFFNHSFTIPEFTTQGLYFSNQPIFPFIFITIACGAISGFHASQSPIVARCMENENDARPVFFGAMVLEGLTALCWAAITLAFFHFQPNLAPIFNASPSVGVSQMASALLGPVGLIITIVGVVICPITSGDTSLRSSRITIADEFNIDQSNIVSRFKIAIPLFLISFLLTFIDFNIIWRYFAWSQLIVATIVLFTATVYLFKNGKLYLIALIPAIFCTLTDLAYILQSPLGFNLPVLYANVLAVIGTVLITIAFIKKFLVK